MFTPAERMGRFRPSASTSAAEHARALKAEGRDIIDLTLGEPDFPTPENVKRAALAAMSADQTHYTNVAGTPALLAAIAHKLKRDNDLEYAAEEIIASAGGKQAMFNAFAATLGAGDEVVVPLPYWISYPNQVLLSDATPVFVEGRAENGYKPAPEDLAAAMGPRTRWLVLNSPCNPTGAVFDSAELEALAEMLFAHPEVWVMADEIYEHLIYGAAEHVSILQVAPGLRDRTLIVNGVSKAYAMTGWRLGFAAGPAALIAAMAKIQSQVTSCPSSIAQAAAAEALAGPQEVLAERRRIMAARRDRILRALNQVEGLRTSRPDGAIYLFCDCRGLLGRRPPEGLALAYDQAVVGYLLEAAGVALVPGGAYGMAGHFRLSFAADETVLEEAGRRLRAACDKLS